MFVRFYSTEHKGRTTIKLSMIDHYLGWVSQGGGKHNEDITFENSVLKFMSFNREKQFST